MSTTCGGLGIVSAKVESGRRSRNRLVVNSDANGRFHSDWLGFIYSRLRLARNLLSDEGVMFISIDHGEVANLRRLCDEIFGEENFVALFVREKRTTRENRRVFSFNHEYVICVARDQATFEMVRNLVPTTDEVKERYANPNGDHGVLAVGFSQCPGRACHEGSVLYHYHSKWETTGSTAWQMLGTDVTEVR
jgi:hypothetical protein